MKIIIINKEVFQDRPPIISTLLSLSDLGYAVSLICVDINDYWRNELERREIEYFIIPDGKRKGIINKVLEYFIFKQKSLSLLSSRVKNREDTVLWVIGGNTVFCLRESLRKYRFILQLQELHENDTIYKHVFTKLIDKAEAVFVNEYNRAILYQCWYRLRKRPFVIPNKPYFIDTKSDFDLSRYVEHSSLEKIQNSKVILFQGQIVSYRDLSPYIRAAKDIGGYQVVLLGNEYGMVERYRQIDDSLIYIRRIPAPHYLGITALAHICLITYDPRSLNNAYCAPNKIFEYGAFGKPMIGNDIPGLKTIEDYHAGILVDEDNIETIKLAIKKVENDYQTFSIGAKRLYESIDNNATISAVLKSIN